MKIPAIRGKIGTWTYYTALFSFQDIANYVKKIDDELHKSEKLSEMIQRSISENYLEIKKYILNQDERFFNSLVLAVYDGKPKWIEVELTFKEEEFFNLGLLELTGEEKIFPVDGQHRVEGIKAALQTETSLAKEKVPVVLISHSTDDEGMRKSRRLFSTLNRYRKPVGMHDIIALDEDDLAAILTRELLEEGYPLFAGERIVIKDQKAIPDSNKEALTSIITLYQCNKELLKHHWNGLKKQNETSVPKSFDDYLKFLRSEEEYADYRNLALSFWNGFSENLSSIKSFLSSTSKDPAKKYRNSRTGGNLLFRPVGLFPFVQASLRIHAKTDADFGQIFKNFDDLDLSLNRKPWVNLVWSKVEKKMLMGAQGVTKQMLIYLYDSSILSSNEIKKLKEGYAGKISHEGGVSTVLRGLKRRR